MKLPIIVSSRQEASCGRSDCDATEQPEHWVDVEFDEPVLAAITQAKAALVGDSNDAEHDALTSLMRSLGFEVPQCVCAAEHCHHDDCPCKAWEAAK